MGNRRSRESLDAKEDSKGGDRGPTGWAADGSPTIQIPCENASGWMGMGVTGARF